MGAGNNRQAQDRMPSAARGPSPESAVFQVRRPDTLQFATIEGICRMAGVGQHRLRRLIAKEAVNNALFECDRVGLPCRVRINRDGNRYTIENDGGGIPRDAATLADLFSANRAMLSGKFLRVPRRGLLGNGLRCLAAVALSGETMTVEAGEAVSTRLAVTLDAIETLSLPAPRQPMGRPFFRGDTVQAEAFSPNVLAAILRTALQKPHRPGRLQTCPQV
jgi:hypothetical protein